MGIHYYVDEEVRMLWAWSWAGRGGRGSASAIQVDDSLDPGDIVGHLGVDTVLAALATALAETGDAENGPAAAHLAEQRPA